MFRSGVAGYAAVHARVRAMYSTMLTPEMWARLREAEDFPILITMLKETVYGPYLSQVEDKDLSPRRAVYQIKGRLTDACMAAISMVPEHARPLLSQLYRRFEVDNLKAILRGIVTGSSWDQVRYVLFPLGSSTVLPAQAMVEAGNVEAAVEQLQGTPYYATLSHAMRRYTAEQSLFPLEVALDLDYWRTLWSRVGRLQGQDHQQAVRIVGSLIDTNNLMWAIRYRVYHHLSEEEIINYTLPFGHRVRDADIRAIAAGADIAQVVTGLYPELTGVDELLQEPRRGLSQLELQLRRYVAEQCRAAFLGYPFHVGIPLAYIVLSEMEIDDLTVLIEAKSLQRLPEEFVPYLVLGGGMPERQATD
ncbi:MAG: V-type ATPase subunit [Anaerolineae bacterium]|nr:V-type ATPase subunit [Anaerolineae bacterium]